MLEGRHALGSLSYTSVSRDESMRATAHGLPRTRLPGARVNRGEKRAGVVVAPTPQIVFVLLRSVRPKVEVPVACAAQRDEILKLLLRIVLVGAVMYLQFNVSAPTQAAAIAVSGMDAPF